MDTRATTAERHVKFNNNNIAFIKLSTMEGFTTIECKSKADPFLKMAKKYQ